MTDEQPPDLIAQLDQFAAAMASIATLIRSYHQALVVQGFSEDQALALALAFQTQVLHGAQS